MARRCFNADLILSDSFMDLPNSAKVLYVIMNLYADCYGIVATPKRAMRECGATDEDISALLAEGYLIEFDSGKVCIRHWLQHNQIQWTKLAISGNVHEMKQLLVVEDTGEYLHVGDKKVEYWRKCSAVLPPKYKSKQNNSNENNSNENNSNENENNSNETKDKGKQTQKNHNEKIKENQTNSDFAADLEKIRKQKKGT